MNGKEETVILTNTHIKMCVLSVCIYTLFNCNTYKNTE